MTHHEANTTEARASARRARRGFTMLEAGAVAGALAIVAVATVPVFRKVGCSAMRAQSATQLATLSAAHAAYAADHDGRQFTLCPDDLGAFGGNFTQWEAVNGCAPRAIFGTTQSGQTYSAGTSCAGGGDGSPYLVPMTFSLTGPHDIGSHRITNVRQFNTYVGGRFYDQTFYAPDDPGINRRVQRNINAGLDYEPDAQNFTSYDYSPAAMYDPQVFGLGTNPNSPIFRNPNTLAGGVGYRSPSNAMCVHPALKTRLLEHSAYDNSPGANPAYAGGTTPYQWNHSLRSRSLALFFDGSVRLFGTSEAMKAEARAGGAKLWLRNAPLSNGYGESQSHDFFVDTSAHWLTAMGIAGRDTLAPD
jgi:type II secretory pathway pseudopilin PulG